MSDTLISPRMRSWEVSRYLRCSRDHLYSLDRAGLLRKRSDGGRFVYWLRKEVELFAVGGNPYATPEQNTNAPGAAVCAEGESY